MRWHRWRRTRAIQGEGIWRSSWWNAKLRNASIRAPSRKPAARWCAKNPRPRRNASNWCAATFGRALRLRILGRQSGRDRTGTLANLDRCRSPVEWVQLGNADCKYSRNSCASLEVNSEVRTNVRASSFIASRVSCEPWYASIFRRSSGKPLSSMRAWFWEVRCGRTSEGLNSADGFREVSPRVMANRKIWLHVFRTRRAMSFAPRPWMRSIMRTISFGSMWARGFCPMFGKTFRSSRPKTSWEYRGACPQPRPCAKRGRRP